MKSPNLKNQGGVALILFVLMLMGVGGIFFVGYSQGLLKQVELSKTEHNTRVLNEAKQALLQYAYNYPQFNSEGPGRLPCPDDDNNGLTGSLSLPLCQSVGRLPWAETELNFYDARDADGERLWYAVSDSFYNLGGGPIINSDSVGSITLIDQAENIIYDGNGAGIAAIIIAPGSAIARDEDNDGIYEYTQVRGTVAQQNLEKNYLDTLNGFDNSEFINNSSALNSDGFILGPIRESDQTSPSFNTIVVNDQMIVITATEVIEVAEKATLQAYRTAINDYLTQTGNVYPWLYNYTGVPDVAGLSSFYPALASFDNPTVGVGEQVTYLDNFGRIPSIDGDYFTETGSQPFEAKLSGSISLDGPATVGGFVFFDGPTLDFQTADKLTDVQFVDLADVVGDDGRLTGTMTAPEIFTWEVYFWEYDYDEPYNNGWALCADGADEFFDCSRDGALDPSPGVTTVTHLDIIRATITLDLTGVVNFDMDYTIPPVIAPPVAATATSHATITGTYAGADIISRPSLTATWERDEHFHAGDTTFDAVSSGTWNAAEMDNFDNGPLSLEMRFYPELPDWVFDNGWHNSVMMAYAKNYRPDILGACIEGDPPSPTKNECMTVANLAGNNDNKISILTLAGQHNWDDDADSNFINDLPTIFDAENADIFPQIDNSEYLFDRKEAGGNDKILVIEEL